MKQDEKTKVMRLLKELSASIDKTKEDIRNMIAIAGLKKRSKTEVCIMTCRQPAVHFMTSVSGSEGPPGCGDGTVHKATRRRPRGRDDPAGKFPVAYVGNH